MVHDSKEKSFELNKRYESLNGVKRYFGIESQEDDYEFLKYIKKHTSLHDDESNSTTNR